MRCLVLLLSVLAIANARELLAPKCQLPKAVCGGLCVNLNSDLANCGACGNTCRPGESCAGNAKRCKCGPINNSCRSDQVCTPFGTCVCNPGLDQCGATCVDLQDDAANCGACGNACAGPTLSGQCVAGDCQCAAGLEKCGAECLDLLTDVDNCGACGNACDAGNVCDGGVCKCTSSAQCPDEAPICGADGACTQCTYANDQGLPCAIRAAALGVTEFQCDYPHLGGTGRCVECNVASRANDNDCAFLISHPYPGAETVPTIDPAYTYCGADNVCTTPPQ